ncbi:MAG: RNA-binding protein [Methylococcales bacterium]|nr:RNA-binding protein [Methylococcales bacterium]MDD5631212.1 RNA-binding protein [Methylococcales bacterium]
MIIFLRNIPYETTKQEIAGFIGRAFNDFSLLDKPSPKIELEDISILSIKDVNSNALEKHALVNVFPNEAGKNLIEKLDGTAFKGECLTIREYINRSMDNDRRNNPLADTTTGFTERRVSDRRRHPVMNSWQNNPILVCA